MKQNVFFAGIAALLLLAHPAQAASPSLLVENSASCPGQLAEFKQALALDPKIIKAMPPTSQGYALVSISNPQKEVDPRLRSSGYGLSSWELSPTLDTNGSCVPIPAAEIVKSVHQWNQPSPLIASGAENCRKEIGEILDAQQKRPDLFAGWANICRATTDTTLDQLLPPNSELPNRRVIPAGGGTIDIIPNLEANSGRCIPVKSKDIIQALDTMKKALEKKAEYSAPGLAHDKTGALEDVLDSKVAGVTVLVGVPQ